MFAVSTQTAIKILNLTSDERIVSLFTEHSAVITHKLKNFTAGDVWDELDTGAADPETQELFKFAYCYYLLSSTAEFLNLKTLGEGIIKTTGIDTQATELLTGSEIKAFQKRLEIKALETILDYLNYRGKDRLQELKPGRTKTRKTKFYII